MVGVPPIVNDGLGGMLLKKNEEFGVTTLPPIPLAFVEEPRLLFDLGGVNVGIFRFRDGLSRFPVLFVKADADKDGYWPLAPGSPLVLFSWTRSINESVDDSIRLGGA